MLVYICNVLLTVEYLLEAVYRCDVRTLLNRVEVVVEIVRVKVGLWNLALVCGIVK